MYFLDGLSLHPFPPEVKRKGKKQGKHLRKYKYAGNAFVLSGVYARDVFTLGGVPAYQRNNMAKHITHHTLPLLLDREELL
jgi:hypothetical protein